MFLRDPKPATHNLPHSSASVARKPALREIRAQTPRKWGVGIFTPSSYAKSLHIRWNVRFKACAKSRCRKRMKKIEIPDGCGRPLRLYVSAIWFFRSGGPGDFNVGFR